MRPGTDVALIWGILWHILENGWENSEFIAKRTEDIELLREKVAEYDLDRVEKITGVAKERIIESARICSYQKRTRAQIR